MTKEIFKFYLDPRCWPMICIFVLLRIFCCLPYAWMMGIGQFLGLFAYYVIPSRTKIIKKNLSLSFPKLNNQEILKLTKSTWMSHGMGVIESGLAWWGDEKFLRKIVRVEGKEFLVQEDNPTQSLMILSAHFTTLDLCGRCMSMFRKFSVTARRQSNKCFDYFITKFRSSYYQSLLFSRDIKQVYKRLAQRESVAFLLDLDFARSNGNIFVPFMGIQTLTTTSLAKIAKKTQCRVITAVLCRLPNNKGYVLKISPPLKGYPSKDPKLDAIRYNQFIEKYIREYPEQYFWSHRRFKTRPCGEESFYVAGA